MDPGPLLPVLALVAILSGTAPPFETPLLAARSTAAVLQGGDLGHREPRAGGARFDSPAFAAKLPGPPWRRRRSIAADGATLVLDEPGSGRSLVVRVVPNRSGLRHIGADFLGAFDGELRRRRTGLRRVGRRVVALGMTGAALSIGYIFGPKGGRRYEESVFVVRRERICTVTFGGPPATAGVKGRAVLVRFLRSFRCRGAKPQSPTAAGRCPVGWGAGMMLGAAGLAALWLVLRGRRRRGRPD